MKHYELFQFLALCIATVGAIGNLVLTVLHVLGRV